MLINTTTRLFLISFTFLLSGCVVVSTAVGVTTSVIGGVVEVVDTVTPDILDDDEQDDGSKE